MCCKAKRSKFSKQSHIANFVNKTDFDNQVNNATSKKWIKQTIKKVKAIPTKGLTKDWIDEFSIINGEKYFSLGIFQNYLVFIPAIKWIKYLYGFSQIYSWKSNGMSEKSTEEITKSDSNFDPTFADHHSLTEIILMENIISIPKK